MAAATGNVTNQAVQFQNNGSMSRQNYGPSISCNGSTMTFSPFYMGNHTKPWEINDSGQKGDEISTKNYKIPFETLVKSTFLGNRYLIKCAETF